MMWAMPSVIVIAHNLRSTHNVGSLLRTADGLGVDEVILSGYTPYPASDNDARLPHEAAKLTKQIHKTALGAETTVKWRHEADIQAVIGQLQSAGYTVAALEQASHAILLPEYQPTDKVALVLGREAEGMEPDVLALCDHVIEIPMKGAKESFNVIQAAAIALYHIQYST